MFLAESCGTRCALTTWDGAGSAGSGIGRSTAPRQGLKDTATTRGMRCAGSACIAVLHSSAASRRVPGRELLLLRVGRRAAGRKKGGIIPIDSLVGKPIDCFVGSAVHRGADQCIDGALGCQVIDTPRGGLTVAAGSATAGLQGFVASWRRGRFVASWQCGRFGVSLNYTSSIALVIFNLIRHAQTLSRRSAMNRTYNIIGKA